MPTGEFLDLDGPVHFKDHGGDGPTMVLIHGLGGSYLNWATVGPRLAKRIGSTQSTWRASV